VPDAACRRGRAALAAAERELPVVTDAAAALDAQALLEACHAAGALEWSLALACSLDNTLLLAGARREPPLGWVGLGSGLVRPRAPPLARGVAAARPGVWPAAAPPGWQPSRGWPDSCARRPAAAPRTLEQCRSPVRVRRLRSRRCAVRRAELRQRHAELWEGFAQAVRMRPSLSAYWDAVGAVDALPPPPRSPPAPSPELDLPPMLSPVASLPLSVRGRSCLWGVRLGRFARGAPGLPALPGAPTLDDACAAAARCGFLTRPTRAAATHLTRAAAKCSRSMYNTFACAPQIT